VVLVQAEKGNNDNVHTGGSPDGRGENYNRDEHRSNGWRKPIGSKEYGDGERAVRCEMADRLKFDIANNSIVSQDKNDR
jgi:hypothetical protein